MNLGDQITKKLTTSRLYMQVAGDAFWRDFGNVIEYKYDPKVTRKEHMKSSGGLRRTDLSLASTINPAYTIIVDEHTPDLEQLRNVGTQAADSVQAGAVIVAEALTAASLQGRVYFTTQPSISAYAVKVAGIAKVENVDYSVDPGSGAITILNGGAIANASAVTIDYTSGAVTQHVFNAYTSLLLQGSIKLVEYDQFNTIPRQIVTFTGQLYVTNWGDNKGDYNQVTLDAIPLTNPVIKTRAD